MKKAIKTSPTHLEMIITGQWIDLRSNHILKVLHGQHGKVLRRLPEQIQKGQNRFEKLRGEGHLLHGHGGLGGGQVLLQLFHAHRADNIGVHHDNLIVNLENVLELVLDLFQQLLQLCLDILARR